MKNDTFKKYYRKLACEGLLKSFLVALCIALFVETAILAAFWFVGIKRIWLSVAISAGVCALLVPALYYMFFRPTTSSMARRLDKLGLEERLLTMNELLNDDSYIAMRQREDARQALAAVDPKNVKFVLSKTLLVLLIVSFVSAGSMTTVSALTNSGRIPGGDKIIDDITKNETYITVRYVGVDYQDQNLFVLETPDSVGGMIEGPEEQLVASGENGEPVVAVSDPDWVFLCWGDQSEDPSRMEEAVVVDESTLEGLEYIDGSLLPEGLDFKAAYFDMDGGRIIYIADDGSITVVVFALFTELGEGEGEGDGGDGMPEDGAEADKPQDGDDSDSDSDNDNSSDGENDKDSKGDNNQKPDSPSGKDNNKVIDGNQDYKSRLEEYIKKAEEYKQNGEPIPDELWELIKQYYDLIS